MQIISTLLTGKVGNIMAQNAPKTSQYKNLLKQNALTGNINGRND